MALGFLSGGGSGSSVKHFDIRLNDNYVVFRGFENEAASVHLRGTVVLCITEPLTIKNFKLTLSGISRVSWPLPASISVGSTRRALKEHTFFEKVWMFRDPGKGKTETLKPDNYEFPFDIVLEATLPESIEGLPDSRVIYRFKADVGRKYSKDVHVRKPLRVIRTLGPTALETLHEMFVQNIWPNKIQYHMGTPSKAVVFGTSLQVDYRLIPLLKGLRIGKVTTVVEETQEFTIDPGAGEVATNYRKENRKIASDEYNVEAHTDLEVIDEEVEGHRFSRYLELPKTLNKCLQDADVHGIKIRHRIKFNVALHNPDGHVSELRATIPVSLFISPALEINDENDLVDQSPVASLHALANDPIHSVPPLYGEHQYDLLYSEIDLNDIRTPGNLSTPGTPLGSHSRNISSENLSSPNAATVGTSTNRYLSPEGASISPVALQNRLQNLRVSGAAHSPLVAIDNSEDEDGAAQMSQRPSAANAAMGEGVSPDTNTSPESHSNRQSPYPCQGHRQPNGYLGVSAGTSLSHRTSMEEEYQHHFPSGSHTPVAHAHEVEDLGRIPSYSTAVRTPTRMLFSGPEPPSYGDATRAANPPAALPAQPPVAHVHDTLLARER